MKKLLICTLTLPLLFACASERQSIAQINAERNAAGAIVTAATLQQHRMQRQTELENSILRRQQDKMENQTSQEKTNRVMGVVGGVLGTIFR